MPTIKNYVISKIVDRLDGNSSSVTEKELLLLERYSRNFLYRSGKSMALLDAMVVAMYCAL